LAVPVSVSTIDEPLSVPLAHRTWFLPVLAGLFFLSGISGLIYQSLWLRLLSLVFGVTVYAASTVLASFMGGLALGTVIAGRLTRRVRTPLAWFGAVELGIAITALSTPWALSVLQAGWLWVHARIPDQLWALTLARFAGASVVLLVPTMLMGATLPLVVRSSLARGTLVGSRVGTLYASNTAGAITGALLAGFVLIGGIGIARSFQVAATLNAIVGLSALALSRLAPRDLSPLRPDVEPMASIRAHVPDRGDRLVPAVFAISGFSALALEVVWFRVLVLFVAATTYAFTTMLAGVLFGIAAGSALATPLLERRWNWSRVFGLVQIGTGVLTLGAMLTYLTAYKAGFIPESEFLTSLMIVVPPALAMGFAFPIGVRAWTGRHDDARSDSAARVARLYAINVAGAIAGALCAGFVLIPALGSHGSIIALASCFVAAGAVLVWQASQQTWRRAVIAVVLVAAFARLAVALPSPFAAVQGHRVPPGELPFYLEEGKQTTVGVYSRPMGGRVLYLDGLHQANDSGSMVDLHREIGLLPVAIHPAPRRALIIGLGGGVTAGAVSLADDLHLDIVELSDSVVRGATWFRHVNENVLQRPNVSLRVDDGRNYLLTTNQRYDIVTADIIQPVHAGAGSLYSAEYFRLARGVLAPGGVMLQWIGIRPATQYKLMARTFLDVFPNATAWVGATLLVGTTEPLTLDARAFQEKLAREPNRHALGLVNIQSFEQLTALYTAGPDQLRDFVGPGPILTDDQPLVEYHRSLPANEPDIDPRPLHDDVRRWIR
jgi:spermidine synthase